MTAAANTAKRAGRGRRRRENQRHDQGLTAKEKAALERIHKWFLEHQNRRQGHAGR